MGVFRGYLMGLGFLEVTGMQETIKKRKYAIELAPEYQRHSWNTNQGVLCCIDTAGGIWIAPRKLVEDRFKDVFWFVFSQMKNSDLHVPFSNDGGRFLRDRWPWLYKK